MVSLDADLQHDPDEIPRLLEPILSDQADLVIGTRAQFPYFSERVIAGLTSLESALKTPARGIERSGRALSMEWRYTDPVLVAPLY